MSETVSILREQTPEITLGEVRDFYLRGVHEYGHVVLGEYDAKTATLLAMAQGSNVALLGVPGGGKTELNEASHRIVGGLEVVTGLPAQADLKPERVIGAHVQIDRVTNGSEEEITTDLPPLLIPETQKIEIDEASRINPHALGVTLELMRRRKVLTTAGWLELNDLEYVGATLNPSESRQNTFTIADAFASRFPLAAVMGIRDLETMKAIGRGMESAPENISPITTVNELHGIRQYVKSPKIGVGEPAVERMVDVTSKMVDMLAREFNFNETDNRMMNQIRKNAKVLAAFNGNVNGVTEYEIQQAAKFIFSARLGMAGLRGAGLTVNDIHSATEEVLA